MDYALPGNFLKTAPIKAVAPAMLPRTVARETLGLAAGGRYILLMPGADSGPDVIAVCAEAIKQAGAVPVIAHWPMSRLPAPDVEGAIVIETIPLAPFYDAFDAVVSAAGYNSFHELLAWGGKVVFVPQDDAGRDNQIARAQYAVDHGLAASCSRRALHLLPELLAHLGAGKAQPVDWLTDWQPVAQAMGIAGGSPGDIAYLPRTADIRPALFKRLHKRWLKRNTPFRTSFTLAFDIETENFLKKKVDTTQIIVTNSIDPVLLRRAGYRFLWVNAMSDHALTRQVLNWLNVWRPARIKSL
jgi:hypothetical protein